MFALIDTFCLTKVVPKFRINISLAKSLLYYLRNNLKLMKQKVSILGCGWLGKPLGKYLSSRSYTVKGSTTRATMMTKIAMEGILPFQLNANPVPDGPNIDGFFDCDVLIVTLPPPHKPMIPDWAFMVHSSISRKAVEYGIKKVILISSTSVYPNEDKVYREADAQRIVSNHSGTVMLDLEKCYTLGGISSVVLRLGGLFGPGRDPGKFLSADRPNKNPDNSVNMVHLDDVISAVHFVLEQEVSHEVFNIVSPELCTRRDFYNEAAKLRDINLTWEQSSSGGKRVSSEKILQKGFVFRYPKALDAF